jgi:hypothetical protein
MTVQPVKEKKTSRNLWKMSGRTDKINFMKLKKDVFINYQMISGIKMPPSL